MNFLKGPDGNNLRFYWEPRENMARSAARGRPQFDKALFVEVVPPGQARSTVVHELEVHIDKGEDEKPEVIVKRQDIIDRYKEAYQSFLADGEDAEIGGVPLDMYPMVTVTQRAELAAMNVFTVEQLAELSDTGINAFGMGARKMVDQARAYIQATEGAAPFTDLQKKNADLEELAKAQADQMKAMQAQIDRLEAASGEPTPKAPPAARKKAGA